MDNQQRFFQLNDDDDEENDDHEHEDNDVDIEVSVNKYILKCLMTLIALKA